MNKKANRIDKHVTGFEVLYRVTNREQRFDNARQAWHIYLN